MLEALLGITVLAAVVFDFTNGFHDTANAIATSISTRALTPHQAVGLSAVFNLIGAIITVVFFNARVSNTIAGIVGHHASLVLILSALLGAICWNLITWSLGLPSSSTHALVGGLVGAGLAASKGPAGIHWASVVKVVLSLVISPPLGFLMGAIFMVLLVLAVHRLRPAPLNRAFRGLQVLTAAFVSYSHGSNDAQKTMATIALGLLAAGQITHFYVPVWVVVLSACAIGAGTYAGGWRIIRTLGWQIYKLEPATGMGAQLMGAVVIQAATQVGLPVSTTHVVTGTVMGAGAPEHLGVMRWGLTANIVGAWVVTIPAAAIVAWIAYAILHTAGLAG